MPDSILAIKKPGWFEPVTLRRGEPIKGGAVVLEVSSE